MIAPKPGGKRGAYRRSALRPGVSKRLVGPRQARAQNVGTDARVRIAMAVIASMGVGSSLACKSGPNDSELEVSRLRRQVVQMQSELVRSQKRMDALELRVTDLARRPPELSARAANQRVETPPQLPRVRVGPEGQEILQPSDGPPVLIRVRGDGANQDESKEAAASSGPERLYHRALSSLREDRNPKLALRQFSNFRRRYPRHALVDNTLYWSGEAEMMLLEHNRALVMFQRVLRDHPRSAKVPWAELRTAESELALGQLKQGRTRLRRVQQNYPGSEPARLAEARLKTMAALEETVP